MKRFLLTRLKAYPILIISFVWGIGTAYLFGALEVQRYNKYQDQLLERMSENLEKEVKNLSDAQKIVVITVVREVIRKSKKENTE